MLQAAEPLWSDRGALHGQRRIFNPDLHYAEISFGSPGLKRQTYTLGFDPAKRSAGKVMEDIEASRSANPQVEVKVRFVSGQEYPQAGGNVRGANIPPTGEEAFALPAGSRFANGDV